MTAHETFPWAINVDPSPGTPEYNARISRRLLSHLMMRGVSDRLGARAGVHPGGLDAITISGTTVTVRDSTWTVYPAQSSSDAPYIVYFLEHTHDLNPAEASERIDIIVIRVYDDDHDSSGSRFGTTEYIVGSAGSGQPSTPSGTVLGAVITVPAGGSPSPSLDYVAPFVVASGGILPVRGQSELPTSGLYDGMTVFDQDLGMQLVRHNGAWRPTSSVVELDHANLSGTIGSGTDLVVPSRLRGIFRSYEIEVDAGIPEGTVQRVEVYVNGDTGNNYRWDHDRFNPDSGNHAGADADGDDGGVIGVVHDFSPSMILARFRPRSLGQVDAMSWAAHGWANAGGGLASTVTRAGGRWSGGSLQDIEFFRIGSSDIGFTWASNSSATLRGLL